MNEISCHFVIVPHGVDSQIYSYLNEKDLFALGTTCKHFLERVNAFALSNLIRKTGYFKKLTKKIRLLDAQLQVYNYYLIHKTDYLWHISEEDLIIPSIPSTLKDRLILFNHLQKKKFSIAIALAAAISGIPDHLPPMINLKKTRYWNKNIKPLIQHDLGFMALQHNDHCVNEALKVITVFFKKSSDLKNKKIICINVYFEREALMKLKEGEIMPFNHLHYILSKKTYLKVSQKRLAAYTPRLVPNGTFEEILKNQVM